MLQLGLFCLQGVLAFQGEPVALRNLGSSVVQGNWKLSYTNSKCFPRGTAVFVNVDESNCLRVYQRSLVYGVQVTSVSEGYCRSIPHSDFILKVVATAAFQSTVVNALWGVSTPPLPVGRILLRGKSTLNGSGRLDVEDYDRVTLKAAGRFYTFTRVCGDPFEDSFPADQSLLASTIISCVISTILDGWK
jgi:hypothetical protein